MIVALIGLPGAGKSTVGRLLADMRGVTFCDLDDAFELRHGMSIREFFAAHGEEAFRDHETALLQEHTRADAPYGVISTGGGVVIREANRTMLQACTFAVWLRVQPQQLHQRLASSGARPLFNGRNVQATLAQLHAQRQPLYEQTARLVVDGDGRTPQAIAHEINQALREHDTAGDDALARTKKRPS